LIRVGMIVHAMETSGKASGKQQSAGLAQYQPQ
jgi:hypothetical protein